MTSQWHLPGSYSLTFMQYACKASDCPDLSRSNLYNNNLIHDNMHFTFLLCKAGVPKKMDNLEKLET
jgi:hypothetical protein